MKGLPCRLTLRQITAPLLNVHIVKTHVTGCWYKQTHVRVAMFATYRVCAPFWRGPKSILCALFRDKKSIIQRYLQVKWRPYMSRFQYEKFEGEGHSL